MFRLPRSVAIRPLPFIALLAALPLPAPAHAAPPAGFVPLPEATLAATTGTYLPLMPAPLDPFRRFTAFEMGPITTWDQMDAWWANDGTLLILDALRPAPDVATLPRIALQLR